MGNRVQRFLHGKMEMLIDRKIIILGMGAVALLFVISFGFGYFFGRYQQIQINKSLLEVIPDVNCGSIEPKNKG